MRRTARWLTAAAMTIAPFGCTRTPGQAHAAPRTAAALRAAIAREVEFPFDVSVFVVADGKATTAGSTDRLYAFDSITKTITGLLLARLAESTDLELSTPIGALLDAGGNADITLVQLATHTAGLPRLAPNSTEAPQFDARNPYARYTAGMAESAVRAVRRGKSEYSNFGYQLLGLALERAAKRPLGELAREFVFAPAGMATARIPQGPSQLPDGVHAGQPARAWDELLGGAGGAIGTIEDLAAYASTLLHPPVALRAAIDTALPPRANGIGLAWITTGDQTWHNGASNAYSSVIVLDRAHGRAAGYLAATGDLDNDADRLVFDFVKSG